MGRIYTMFWISFQESVKKQVAGGWAGVGETARVCLWHRLPHRHTPLSFSVLARNKSLIEFHLAELYEMTG